MNFIFDYAIDKPPHVVAFVMIALCMALAILYSIIPLALLYLFGNSGFYVGLIVSGLIFLYALIKCGEVNER